MRATTIHGGNELFSKNSWRNSKIGGEKLDFEEKGLDFGVAEGVEPPSSLKRSEIRGFNAKSYETRDKKIEIRNKSPEIRGKKSGYVDGLLRPHRETEKKSPPEPEDNGVSKLFARFLSFLKNDTTC